jgi:hypothetical protein
MLLQKYLLPDPEQLPGGEPLERAAEAIKTAVGGKYIVRHPNRLHDILDADEFDRLYERTPEPEPDAA